MPNAGGMRLRSARLAAADAEALPEELPTVTKRCSRKKAKVKQTEAVEADAPASGKTPQLQMLQEPKPNTGPVPNEQRSSAQQDVDLQAPGSPVFNAEAAAEAARLAEALLSASPLAEGLGTAGSRAGVSSQQPNSLEIGGPSVDRAAGPSAQASAGQHPLPDQETADCSSAAALPNFNASRPYPTATAAHGQQAARSLPGVEGARDRTAGPASSSADIPDAQKQAGQLGTSAGANTAVAAHETQQEGVQLSAEQAQHNSAAGATGMQPAVAEMTLALSSPKHRKAHGRASLALQSRRASRSGSADAFERGVPHAGSLLTGCAARMRCQTDAHTSPGAPWSMHAHVRSSSRCCTALHGQQRCWVAAEMVRAWLGEQLRGCICNAGRKSGIWLGSADVRLGNIEQQWTTYKVSSTCNHSLCACYLLIKDRTLSAGYSQPAAAPKFGQYRCQGCSLCAPLACVGSAACCAVL